MHVHLTDALQAHLLGHARSAAPFEACGLVGGRQRGATICLDRYRPQINRSPRAATFAIDPRDIARACAELHAEQRQLLAVFHSHCNRAAVPSAADRAGAWPELLQLLCAVYGDAAGAVRAWSPSLDWAAVPVTISA